MRETEQRRRSALSQPASRLSSSRSSLSEHSAPVQRERDGSAVGQLAYMQATMGNQAVVQRMKSDAFAGANAMPRTAPSSTVSGTGMPPNVQAKMEHALGADLSGVRIHTGPQANAVGALAYTQGTDIHFAPGQYNPESRKGQELLGHELAHVVQQSEGRVTPTAELATGQSLNDSPALEQEADRLGKMAANAPEAAEMESSAAKTESEEGSGVVQRAAAPGPASSAASTSSRAPIQRMPRPSEVKKQLGEPKEHVKNPLHNRLTKKLGMSETLKKNSTHYRAFLAKLELFDRYVDQEIVGNTPDEIDQQLNQIMTLYGEVETVSDAYMNHNKNDDKDSKVVYIRKLKDALPLEKKAVRSSAAEYKLDPLKERPFWTLLTSTSLIQLTDDMNTGETGRGGINTVAFFEIGPDMKGVFKETKLALRSYDEMPEEASEKDKDAADIEYMFATKDAGIDPKDAHMANRNVAMHRLDKLLGAGVIARAEFALYNNGVSIVQGSYMEKAKGKSADKVLNPMLEDIESGKEASFDVNDPAFQRAMSRLQLIDTLSMQVDRHVGNFFIHRDEDGNVISVTGIDNDMAFGMQTDLDTKHKEYPGLSRYVDKELAERILALKPDDLRTLMEDLLTPAEINALIDRLVKLQNHLRKESTRLLDKNEWSQVTDIMRKGDKSYGANLDIPISHARSKAAKRAIVEADV